MVSVPDLGFWGWCGFRAGWVDCGGGLLLSFAGCLVFAPWW